MSRVRYLFAALGFCAGASLLPAEDYEMRLSKRVEEQPGQFRMVESVEKWNPVETAVIVCDMWDLHHCKNAVDRAVQMAPRMNALLKAARKRGSQGWRTHF